jgi:hypothetical protein
MDAGLSSPAQLGAIGVGRGGGVAEVTWPPRLTPTPPATIVGLTADVSRCQRRGGRTEASKPTRLSSQSVGPFIGADQSRQGGTRREGVGGTVEAPWPPRLQPAPCRRYYLRVLDPSTSVVPPPPITCTPAVPELHRSTDYLPQPPN